MKVVITGGAGFLGVRLARQILDMGALTAPSGESAPVEELLLFDQVVPQDLAATLGGPVTTVEGDISDRATVESLIDRDHISVFHLASVVSVGGEKDFDLAIRVNLDCGRYVLDALITRASQPRLVFASSIAVFGGAAMPDSVGDTTKQTPQTTYGATKAILELLINDYTRKGVLNGRSARLPTVIIRPCTPNASASGFPSALFPPPSRPAPWVAIGRQSRRHRKKLHRGLRRRRLNIASSSSSCLTRGSPAPRPTKTDIKINGLRDCRITSGNDDGTFVRFAGGSPQPMQPGQLHHGLVHPGEPIVVEELRDENQGNESEPEGKPEHQ